MGLAFKYIRIMWEYCHNNPNIHNLQEKKNYIFIYCFKFKICCSKGFKRKLQNGNFKTNTLNVTLSMKHTQSSCSCMNQPRTVNNWRPIVHRAQLIRATVACRAQSCAQLHFRSVLLKPEVYVNRAAWEALWTHTATWWETAVLQHRKAAKGWVRSCRLEIKTAGQQLWAHNNHGAT